MLLCTAADASAQRLKVILDTDIGSDIDDAWALGFAMLSPDIELLGVTITDGDTRARAKMACKLLHVGGRGEVPVAVGRPTPPPDQIDLQFAWAEDFTAKQPVPQSAADFIVETVRRYPGEVTLIAVGPLQNVADALRKDPRLGTALKRVVLMSGSIAAHAWGPCPTGRVERRQVDGGRAGGVRSGAAAHDRAARFDDLCHAERRGARAAAEARLARSHGRSRPSTASGSKARHRV